MSTLYTVGCPGSVPSIAGSPYGFPVSSLPASIPPGPWIADRDNRGSPLEGHSNTSQLVPPSPGEMANLTQLLRRIQPEATSKGKQKDSIEACAVVSLPRRATSSSLATLLEKRRPHSVGSSLSQRVGSVTCCELRVCPFGAMPSLSRTPTKRRISTSMGSHGHAGPGPDRLLPRHDPVGAS